MTITCRLYRDGELREEAFDPARVSDLIEERGSRVWLDLEDPTEEQLALIKEEFGLHELAMEDVRHQDQRSKVEFYGEYFFIVLHGIGLDDQHQIVDSELHIFAGHRFLITLRYRPAFDLTEVLRRWDRQTELTYEGAGYLLYALLDEVVDGYFETIERLEAIAEDLEDSVFKEEPSRELQQSIFVLKREATQVRRLIVPIREVLDLMQEQPGFVTPTLAPYYRDVTDHVIRSLEFAESLREMINGTLQAYESQVTNRLNQVMKQLTAWASIILLPTLIAGIYGMNFNHMPELNWLLGYPFALSLMGVASLVLYVLFKRRQWL